jgi:hypothetical protein
MYALASCTASILRGTSVDQFGDTVDTGTVIATGVPFLIEDVNQRVFDPATQQPRIVRAIEAVCQSNVDVKPGDQVRDDTNNVLYLVNDVTQKYGAAWTPDLDVDLTRITPTQ